MRIFSFSVKPSDAKSIKLVEDLKIHAAKNGKKFSFIVLTGLRLYKESIQND